MTRKFKDILAIIFVCFVGIIGLGFWLFHQIKRSIKKIIPFTSDKNEEEDDFNSFLQRLLTKVEHIRYKISPFYSNSQ